MHRAWHPLELQARSLLKMKTANHALQRIRASRSGCSPSRSRAGSLSLGR